MIRNLAGIAGVIARGALAFAAAAIILALLGTGIWARLLAVAAAVIVAGPAPVLSPLAARLRRRGGDA
jgi:type IV secretory pathway TrbD component